MPRTPKPKQPKPIISRLSTNYSDCRKCIYYQPWKFGLVDCPFSVVPHENCVDRKIECVNYKKTMIENTIKKIEQWVDRQKPAYPGSKSTDV